MSFRNNSHKRIRVSQTLNARIKKKKTTGYSTRKLNQLDHKNSMIKLVARKQTGKPGN